MAAIKRQGSNFYNKEYLSFGTKSEELSACNDRIHLGFLGKLTAIKGWWYCEEDEETHILGIQTHYDQQRTKTAGPPDKPINLCDCQQRKFELESDEYVIKIKGIIRGSIRQLIFYTAKREYIIGPKLFNSDREGEEYLFVEGCRVHSLVYRAANRKLVFLGAFFVPHLVSPYIVAGLIPPKLIHINRQKMVWKGCNKYVGATCMIDHLNSRYISQNDPYHMKITEIKVWQTLTTQDPLGIEIIYDNKSAGQYFVTGVKNNDIREIKLQLCKDEFLTELKVKTMKNKITTIKFYTSHERSITFGKIEYKQIEKLDLKEYLINHENSKKEKLIIYDISWGFEGEAIRSINCYFLGIFKKSIRTTSYDDPGSRKFLETGSIPPSCSVYSHSDLQTNFYKITKIGTWCNKLKPRLPLGLEIFYDKKSGGPIMGKKEEEPAFSPFVLDTDEYLVKITGKKQDEYLIHIYFHTSKKRSWGFGRERYGTEFSLGLEGHIIKDIDIGYGDYIQYLKAYFQPSPLAVSLRNSNKFNNLSLPDKMPLKSNSSVNDMETEAIQLTSNVGDLSVPAEEEKEEEPPGEPNQFHLEEGKNIKLLELSRKEEEEKRRLDSYRYNLVCPLYATRMVDPVIADDGRSYEREAIEEWLKDHDFSPVTNQKLRNKTLEPDIKLREIIRSLRQ